MFADYNVDPYGRRAGLNQGNRLRMYVLRDEELIFLPLLAFEAEAHLHRLGRGGRFVQ